MGILMPLVMMVVVVGVALFALNKWNPAAATTTDAGTVTDSETTTSEEGCTEGNACSCSNCCQGRGCKGGKDNAEMTGATDSNGKCMCSCKDGCPSGGGSNQGSSGGGGGTVTNPPGKAGVCTGLKGHYSCSCGGVKWKMGANSNCDTCHDHCAGSNYARAYNVRASNNSMKMRYNPRMLVEIPNDNDDYLPYPKAYLTYGQDQPEYYSYESTNQITDYSDKPAYFSQYDEQQNSMPFVHMYHVLKQAPVRLANY